MRESQSPREQAHIQQEATIQTMKPKPTTHRNAPAYQSLCLLGQRLALVLLHAFARFVAHRNCSSSGGGETRASRRNCANCTRRRARVALLFSAFEFEVESLEDEGRAGVIGTCVNR